MRPLSLDPRVRVVGLAFLALWILLQAEPSWAVEGKEYAYLFVQGSISDPSGTRPLPGATVRLTAGGRVFEAVTDRGGLFIFEKLPIASYEMRVTNAEGESIQEILAVDLDARSLKRFKIKFGQGDGKAALVQPGGEGVTVVAPEPPVRRGRFWTQFGVFLGCAVALAL